MHLEVLGINSDMQVIIGNKETDSGVLSKMHSHGNSQGDNACVIKSDLMSIGIIIFMLLVGMAPFQGKSSRKIMEEARVGYISFTHLHRHVSVEAKEFVKKLTARQQASPSFLHAFLHDPWITKMSKPNVLRQALSIDILDNLKKFNILNQFEILVNQVKN